MRLNIKKIISMCVLMGLGFMLGLLIPDQLVSRGKAKIQRTFDGLTGEAERQESLGTSFSSIHLGLEAEVIDVPQVELGRGGALTSMARELIVLRRDGLIFVIKDGSVHPTQIAVPDNGLSEYMEAANSKFAELNHKIAFFRYNDILFVDNQIQKFFILSYTEYQQEHECYSNTVAKLELSPATDSALRIEVSPDDWDVLFRTEPCLPLKTKRLAIEGHMAGGRVAFMSPDKIILGSGDYHWDGVGADQAIAQNGDFDYGKVIEINVENGVARTLSKGHRNLQGVHVSADNEIWVTEHGARGGDELNKVKLGADYGWPKTTLGTKYNSLPWPVDGKYARHSESYEKPVLAWLPSIAPSGITQVSGFHEAWNGDLLISSFQSGGLTRVRIVDGRVVFNETISLNKRIRYVQQHSDGRIALWTDGSKVIFLSPTDPGYGNNFIPDLIASLDLKKGQASRLQVRVNRCLECHALSGAGGNRAKSLAEMFGSRVGHEAPSSAALRDVGGIWQLDNLAEFIECPDCVAQGTLMPKQDIDTGGAENMARFLKVLSEQFQ